MLDFFTRFFKREGSSATAKERLRLVLLSDHLSLSPDMVDALKSDLISAISKYVRVDIENCDVAFEQQAGGVAMHMNIPIMGIQGERPPVAPPVYEKSPEPARSILGESGERPYLDDLHEPVPAHVSAMLDEDAVQSVDEAEHEARAEQTAEHSTPAHHP